MFATQLLITCDARTQKSASACADETETGNRSVESEEDEITDDSNEDDGVIVDDDDDDDDGDENCKETETALNMPNAA